MNSKWIKPSDPVFDYTGRIDFDNTDAPVLVYACSSIGFRTNTQSAYVMFDNKHSYYENSIGVAVNGEYRGKIVLHDGERTQGETIEEYLLSLSENGENTGNDFLKNLEYQLKTIADKQKMANVKQPTSDLRVYDLTPYLDCSGTAAGTRRR